MNRALKFAMLFRSKLFFVFVVAIGATLLCSCETVRVPPAEGPLHSTEALEQTTASAGVKAARLTTPVVSLSASPVQVDVAQSAVFTIAKSRVTSKTTTVNYAVSGSAVLGVDYALSGQTGKVVIPAGSTSTNISLQPLQATAAKTASLTLQTGSGYRMASTRRATITIVASTATSTPIPTPVPTATPSASPRPSPALEVWLSIRNDGLPGSGTQTDPYDASTDSKFDTIVAPLPENTYIHLGPGIFWTNITKTWALRSGWVLEGAGIDITTLQLVGDASGVMQTSVLASNSNGPTDNVIIRNLTLDANWAELSQTAVDGIGGEKNIKTGAIAIWGSNNLIDHVRSMNTYGTWANKQEQFVIMLAGPRTGDGTNNVIQYCRVELPRGSYGSPYALFGTQPYVITNSKVFSCSAVGYRDGQNDGFTTGGVNLADVRDCEIDNNTFTDCQGAAYQDTGTTDGIKVTNNTVIRGSMGVSFVRTSAGTKRNIEVSGNNMLIQNRFIDGAGYGVFIANAPSTNVVIKNNTITFDTNGGGLMSFWGIRAADLIGATISENVIGLAPNTYFNNGAYGSGITLLNNQMTDGSPALGLTP